MQITKENFVKIINALIAQIKRDMEIATLLDGVVRDGDNRSLVFSTPLIGETIKALDKNDIISWWFWDGPQHGERAEDYRIFEKNGDTTIIRDAGELYDYMQKE